MSDEGEFARFSQSLVQTGPNRLREGPYNTSNGSNSILPFLLLLQQFRRHIFSCFSDFVEHSVFIIAEQHVMRVREPQLGEKPSVSGEVEGVETVTAWLSEQEVSPFSFIPV
jgi:hypothetical protein